MFSDHDETSLSIAAVSAPSVACSMLAVQQQKRLCRQFVDVFAARRGYAGGPSVSHDQPAQSKVMRGRGKGDREERENSVSLLHRLLPSNANQSRSDLTIDSVNSVSAGCCRSL